MSRSRLARSAASLLLLVATLGLSLGSPAFAAEQHQGGAVSVFWKMQGPGNDLWNIDQLMWMEQKGYKEYWAMQFPLTGTNDAGYMGLQTVATRPDGSVGQMAIFSLWNASGSRNANGKCAPFDGEGNGLSCRMAFTIRDKVRYRYRVWRLESDSVGQWWGAWIQDTSTGRDYHLGDLRVKSRTIGTPLNFTEYWGEAVSCDRVPESIVNWTQPAANSNGRGSYQYYSRYQAPPSKGGCINHAVVKPMNYGWSQGVRVDSGLAI